MAERTIYRNGQIVSEQASEPSADAIATRAARLSAGRLPLIVSERARRLSLGFDYDFGDARGVHRIGTTDADMAGWDEVSKAASALIALGQGSAPLNVVTDTGPVEVTASEWQAILVAAAQHRQPIWAASFALQEMDPIPEDFASDAYWP